MFVDQPASTLTFITSVYVGVAMTDVNHIAVIGGGIMGGGIGQSFLQTGYEVTIRDVDEEVIDESKDRILNGNFGLERGVQGGIISEEEKNQALDRLNFTLDIEEAVSDADMVIEAVPENLLLKGQIFSELDELTDSDIPLLSNTSGFPIAALASATDSPERVAGAHYFNPAVVMNLVEIVETPVVDQSVINTTEAVMEDAGKTPVIVKDAPNRYGFVVNRIWGAMRREAERVVDEGVATKEQVNIAMKEGRNIPVGPFEGAGIGEEWGSD